MGGVGKTEPDSAQRCPWFGWEAVSTSCNMGNSGKIIENNFLPEVWSDTGAGAQRGWQLSTLAEIKKSTSH